MSGELGVTRTGGSAESHGEHPPSYSMERYLASECVQHTSSVDTHIYMYTCAGACTRSVLI